MSPSDDLDILANYESIQLVKSQFLARHNRQASTGKAREIATAFTQARSYLGSAATATRDVRPLLMYYAVLSFSRALTLFLKPKLREANLAQSHGLAAVGWSASLGQDSSEVTGLRIQLPQNGTFIQLIDATNHESYLRSNLSRPNHIEIHDRPTANAEITLGELFARVPEIRSTYIRWKSERCAVQFMVGKQTPDNGRLLRVDAPYTIEDIEAVFGSGLEISSQGKTLTITAPPGLQVGSLNDVTGSWNVGDLVALKRYDCGIELSKIATTFIVSYALGMLVRYHPSIWVGILQNHRHDAAMPTLLAALNYVELEFPRLIVDFLERRPDGNQ